MEFKIEGKSVVTLGYKKGERSSVISTDIQLQLPKELDENMYFNKEGLPNKEGTKALSQCFIQGLIANIHQAHQNGLRDSAEHLRYIISELERGFVELVDVSKGNIDE
jgi:hypothetical protein